MRGRAGVPTRHHAAVLSLLRSDPGRASRRAGRSRQARLRGVQQLRAPTRRQPAGDHHPVPWLRQHHRDHALSRRCDHCKAPIVSVDDLDGKTQIGGRRGAVRRRPGPAVSEFRSWIKSRWFAPNALKKVANTTSLRGGYLPHWGFDDDTTSDYTGERGDHYYTTETYTTTRTAGASPTPGRCSTPPGLPPAGG